MLPDIAPARLFPFDKVRITVTGPGYRVRRFLRLGYANGYEFRVHPRAATRSVASTPATSGAVAPRRRLAICESAAADGVGAN